MKSIDANALRSVRRVTLTEVVMLRGNGTEANHAREVVMVFDDAGQCVAEHDPCYPTPWYAPEEACREKRQPARDAMPDERALAIVRRGAGPMLAEDVDAPVTFQRHELRRLIAEEIKAAEARVASVWRATVEACAKEAAAYCYEHMHLCGQRIAGLISARYA
jgi:hypothetical protein